ncbi:MAG: alpha/beta hydrolase [Pseudomonadales bacterium]|nr:alpha/beta hydrolase [Pseudomonadales bacterium]
MSRKKSLPAPLFGVVFIMLPSFAAAGFFDVVAEKYQRIEAKIERIKERFSSSEAAQVSDTESAYEYPPGWQTHFFAEPIFGGQVFVVEAGDKSKDTILLVHGLGQIGSQDWLDVIPALEDSYRIVAIDLPGFGNSSVPTGRYSPTNYANLLAWLVENHIDDSVAVVGHSMGGAVALRFAANYPALVKQLVLVDAAGILERTAFLKHSARVHADVSNDSKAVRKLGSHLLDLGGSVIELFTMAPDPSPLLASNDELWNRAFSKRPNTNAAMALIMEDFSDAIESLQLSTHIIWGELDTVAPLRTGVLLNGRLPNAKLKTMADAGHVPMKSHTAEFNALLVAALQGGWEHEVESDMMASAPLVDLSCYNAVGQTYSGHFRRVLLYRCIDVILENVTAERMVIKESVVEMTNMEVSSPDVGIIADESVIVATNVKISGQQSAVESIGARFDVAGVSFVGESQAVKVHKKSRFVVSVSDLHSAMYQGHVHGAFTIQSGSLDTFVE